MSDDRHAANPAAAGGSARGLYDVDRIRAQFPALDRRVGDHAVAYLDGPGGTQVPRRVVDVVTDFLLSHNCNTHGAFITSEEAEAVLDDARRVLADFVNADPIEVSFGANMTSLTVFMAQSLVRDWAPGDEVVITALDHEANRGPWLDLRERGLVVREVSVDVETCSLRWEEMEAAVNDRTRLIAVGFASNAVGTVNDVRHAVELAHSVGALCYVDAVHFAPHGVIDVKALDCDFLVCSAYKFFGTHVGMLYAKKEAGSALRVLRLATMSDEPPSRYELGTLCYEAIAGAAEAVEFIADIGRQGDVNISRRDALVTGMEAVAAHEGLLTKRLVEGLSTVPGLRIIGPPADAPRTSTVSFVLQGWQARDVARELGARGLFVWDGDFYAARFVEAAGLVACGGLVRVGLCAYNTADEVDRLVTAVTRLGSGV